MSLLFLKSSGSYCDLVGVMGLQHVTFILKIKSYICITLKEQNSQINMFNKRNLYNITNCILQRFTL